MITVTLCLTLSLMALTRMDYWRNFGEAPRANQVAAVKIFGFKFLHHAAKRGILSGLWDEDEHKGWEMKI